MILKCTKYETTEILATHFFKYCSVAGQNVFLRSNRCLLQATVEPLIKDISIQGTTLFLSHFDTLLC